MPVLVQWGRGDVVFPIRLAEVVVRAVPSERLVTYDACGHFPHEELPERTVADLREFLK